MTPYEHQSLNTSHYLLTMVHYTDFVIQPHFHKNYELLVCLSGQAEMTVNGQTYPIREGECILACGYQIHGFSVPADSHLWVASFAPSLVKSFHALISKNRVSVTAFRLSDSVRSMLEDKMIAPSRNKRMLLESLGAEQELTVKGCLYAVCGEYVQHVTMERNGKGAENVAFDVIRYISENFREDINLQTAAEHLRYNYHYLSKVFNRNVGYNFNSMLNQYRLEFAVQLLEETETPITQIAFESGFQSQRTFNRIFEEAYGVSPREHRRDHRKKS